MLRLLSKVSTPTRKPAAAVLPFNSSVPPKEPTKPSQPAAATAVALSHPPVSTITVGAALPSASNLAVALELQQLQEINAKNEEARAKLNEMQLAVLVMFIVMCCDNFVMLVF